MLCELGLTGYNILMEKRARSFGETLRKLRTRHQESLAEVSGAVEIDVRLLGAIEANEQPPTEELVLLLISHFSLREDEAAKFWQLAGYDAERFGLFNTDTQIDENYGYAEQPIIYTDMVHISANHYGVIINFLQGLGVNGKPTPVARLGMSREHARSILEVLRRTLDMADNHNPAAKRLPPSSKN